jgi:hypothetical protein
VIPCRKISRVRPPYFLFRRALCSAFTPNNTRKLIGSNAGPFASASRISGALSGLKVVELGHLPKVPRVPLMADDALKSAVVSLFIEFEISEICAEEEFLCHLVQVLKTQSSAEAFDTFVSYFPDEHLLRKTWPHFWSSLHSSSNDDGVTDDEQDCSTAAVAELTGDPGVDCFLEMFPGVSAAQVGATLQQHPHDAEAAMFQLMLLHQRRSKSAPQPSGTMGSGLTGSDRESIHAYVLRHPSTIVTEGGVVSNPRLPPELFQTMSKTRYRDNVVVTTKGEKVCARARACRT